MNSLRSPLSFRPLGRSLCVLALALVAWIHTAVAATAQEPIVIRPGGVSKFTIAVPNFEPKAGGSTGGIAEDAIASVVINDLDLSGYFQQPRNKDFVLQTDKMDRNAGAIQFAEWTRIDVAYLVKCTYEVVGDELQVEMRAYDVISQNYVFGRLYQKFKPSETRQIAHRISNDLIERLTGYPGVANTEILFVRQNDPHGKSKQICRMDADGFNARAITPQGELTATPCWGSNGTEVYYTTYRDYNPDLAGYMLQRKHSWWVSRKTGLNISPAWSEKAQLIALTLSKDGNSELYTITREGKESTRLTINPAIDSSPSWSPDGTKLAFTSDRGGSPQIYVMDVKSKSATRVSYDSGNYCDGASWSPTGDRIAYSARAGGNFHIFVVDVDGKNARQITTGGSNNEDPTWGAQRQAAGLHQRPRPQQADLRHER